MNDFKNTHLVLIAVLLLSVPQMVMAMETHLSTMATLSRRSAKPGDHLEMVVTVREATHPRVLPPANLPGLRVQVLHKPQSLSVDDEHVWLFRYRVTPRQTGDYEIPPFHVLDAGYSVETKPLFLHVSQNGELPLLTAKELALGVNISDSLSEEVIKAVPQPPPRPTPSPTPRDTRNLEVRAASSCWHALQAFWNYPGK